MAIAYNAEGFILDPSTPVLIDDSAYGNSAPNMPAEVCVLFIYVIIVVAFVI